MMWTDSETSRDFLNFRAVAKTAAEMIVQANGKPLSLGVCGSWGVGKSSMIKLIREELYAREGQHFVFVNPTLPTTARRFGVVSNARVRLQLDRPR